MDYIYQLKLITKVFENNMPSNTKDLYLKNEIKRVTHISSKTYLLILYALSALSLIITHIILKSFNIIKMSMILIVMNSLLITITYTIIVLIQPIQTQLTALICFIFIHTGIIHGHILSYIFNPTITPHITFSGIMHTLLLTLQLLIILSSTTLLMCIRILKELKIEKELNVLAMYMFYNQNKITNEQLSYNDLKTICTILNAHKIQIRKSDCDNIQKAIINRELTNILEKYNIHSLRNLIHNVNFLYLYYSQYIEDKNISDKYIQTYSNLNIWDSEQEKINRTDKKQSSKRLKWITKQLDRFYNPTECDHIDAYSILINLHN